MNDNDDEKLLDKRVKRPPRKLRSTGQMPPLVAYSKPSATSIVRSQIYSTPKVPQRAAKSTGAIGARLSKPRPLADPSLKKEKGPKMAEHVKVVKHPAPFR